MTDFQRAATVQMRVIGALVLRNFVLIFDESALGLIKVALRPMSVIFLLYLTGQVFSLPHAGFPYLLYNISGVLPWFAFGHYLYAVRMKSELGLLSFPHVTTIDVILSHLVTGFIAYTTIFVVFIIASTMLEQTPWPADPLGLMIAFWSVLTLGLLCGLVLTSITRFTTILNEFSRTIHYIGNIFSGVFLVATQTPETFLRFLKWNPVFQCIEWTRQAWWAPYKSPILDPPYIFECMFFLAAFGLLLERATRKWEA